MEKDFDGWHLRKKKLHGRTAHIFFHEREIWWCSLGVNIGSEQDGKNSLYERPVLVVKKFSRDVLWVVPLTTAQKADPFHMPITVGDEGSAVTLSQIRLISSKRLQRYMRKLPRSQFKRIVEGITRLLPVLPEYRNPAVRRGFSEA